MMKPNAECPVCHDTWRIDLHYATLTEEERKKIKINGILLVVCDDCDYMVDWDSEEAAEWSSAY